MTSERPQALHLPRLGLGAWLERGWRTIATLLCFMAFGAGCLLIWGLLFPLVTSPLLLTLSGQARRRAAAQAVIHASFRALVRLMASLGTIEVEIRGGEKLRRQGLLILANHPTLIDVVLLIAQVRHADCIVKGALARNPFTRHPIRAAGFICNNSGAGLVDDCIASLRAGNNLVIFPEGTRTPRQLLGHDGLASANPPPRLQRGAAQIAVRGAIDVTPVRIRCTPPLLLKGEPWWRLPARRSHFLLEVGDDIAIQPFLDTAQASSEPDTTPGEARAARRLTEFLSSYFFQEYPRATT
ncbi:lysophospholipid acyltransferase family protein [Hylemonella gracilis]|uniref:lysophospholipid acyltransferase family protein n=1 Tax=Hylemonella gracilis TaxID=80880 RepID=UPI000A9F7852|nr:lysophospholipid acyltransferase family protein [Hylemonella gracilis]